LVSFYDFLKEYGESENYDLTKDSDAADAAIIDLDDDFAREEWKNYKHRFPDRPCLVISSDEYADNSGSAIQQRKPIDYRGLSRFLDGVRDPDSIEPTEVRESNETIEKTVQVTQQTVPVTRINMVRYVEIRWMLISTDQMNLPV